MIEKDINVRVNILDYLDNGLDVFDVDGDKIGTVADYNGDTGYMMVRCTQFTDVLLYVHIPFSIITHADPREVFVSKTRDEVHQLYRARPPRTVMVEERTDPDTGQDESWAVTTEPSGYDGSPVVVVEAKVDKLAHHIDPGFHVYTAEMEDIGRIKQYDRAAGRMVVEKGAVSKHDIVIPTSLVSSVNRNGRAVTLCVGSKDLEGMKREKPDAMVSLTPGLMVYDMVAQKVGTVERVDPATGWFVVKTADLPHIPLYIPSRLITQIDLCALVLSLPILELFHDYSTPPERWNASK
jgi:hypothetical protein